MKCTTCCERLCCVPLRIYMPQIHCSCCHIYTDYVDLLLSPKYSYHTYVPKTIQQLLHTAHDTYDITRKEEFVLCTNIVLLTNGFTKSFPHGKKGKHALKNNGQEVFDRLITLCDHEPSGDDWEGHSF